MYADVAAMRARGINVDSIARAIVAEGTKRAGIRIGFTPATLATSTDSAAVRWRRTLYPGLGWIAAFATTPGFIWSTAGIAEHGTPNALDLWVPISFIGSNVTNGRYPRLVRTVDIAPTLALLIGVTPTEKLDGKALADIVAGRQGVVQSPPRKP